MTSSSKKPKKSSPPSASKVYYPVFLYLAGKRCTVIGGGRVAERKCAELIRCGANVKVISPEITTRLRAYKKKRLITHIQRTYKSSDIRSSHLVIVATDSETVNRKVASDALSRSILLNVVDNPSLCGFIMPSVIRRGPLTISISTSGVSPAMAKTIRKELEEIYGTEFPKYLGLLRDIRSRALKEIKDINKRNGLFSKLSSRKMLQRLRKEGFSAAKKSALLYWEKFAT